MHLDTDMDTAKTYDDGFTRGYDSALYTEHCSYYYRHDSDAVARDMTILNAEGREVAPDMYNYAEGYIDGYMRAVSDHDGGY